MIRRYYNPKTKECSHCGSLFTPSSFQYHPEKECYAIAFKKKILEDEIKNYGKFKDKGEGI